MSITALLGLVAAASAIAQPIAVGPEFQVNQFPYAQRDAAVALDGSGKFVVVWRGPGSFSSEYSGIQARRYDAAGNPAGTQFQVNSYVTSPHAYPAVAVDGAGNFVVVWWSYTSETDEFGSVHAQRYDAEGEPVGGQFQVNSYTTSDQTYPAVAVDKSGSFVVVWASYGSAGPDDHGSSIQGQRYDAEGEPIGADFTVNSLTTNDQTYPAVAVDGEGRFIVVWTSYGSAGSDVSSGSIQAQRYDEAGAAVGDQFQVNSYTTSKQFGPVVAADATGNFVVVWNSYGSADTDSAYYSVQAQRYDATGERVGGEFQVNSYTTDDQYEAAVAMDAAGNFVVAWSSYGSGGSDDYQRSIQAQRYDATGAPVGGQFQVNTYTTYGQGVPAVAVDPTGATGNFVVTWTTYDEYEGVFAQRFAAPTTSSSSSTTTSTTLEPTTTTSTTLEPTTTTSTTLEPTTTTSTIPEPTTTSTTLESTTTTSTLATTTTTSSVTTTSSSSTSTTSSSTSTSTLPCDGPDSDGRACDDDEPCTAPDLCSGGACIGQRFCTVNLPLPGPPIPAEQGVRVDVQAEPGATVEAGLFERIPVAAAGIASDPLADEVGEPLSKLKTKRVKRKGRVVLKLKLNALGRERLKTVPGGVLRLFARTTVRASGHEAPFFRPLSLLRRKK